ncbi:MAG: OmpA family protein [Bacteroidota bacterium]
MPTRTKVGVAVLGFALLYAGYWLERKPKIERDLTDRTRTAFAEQTSTAHGHSAPDVDHTDLAETDLVQVRFAGRDAYLTGAPATDAEREAYEAAARGVRGVRAIHATWTQSDGLGVPTDHARLSLQPAADGATLRLRGVVPDAATQATLVTQAQAAFPGETVIDNLVVQPVRVGPGWEETVQALLPVVATLEAGGLEAAEVDFTLTGRVPDADAQAQLETQATTALQPGYRLDSRLAVADAPPPADPEEAAAVAEGIAEALAAGVIQFETATARLTGSSFEILDRIAAALREAPTVYVEVQGHTDNTGSLTTNEALSQRRADAVRAYLIEQGVEAERLTAAGYGDAVPVASNDTPAGRAQNRRVVFELNR